VAATLELMMMTMMMMASVAVADSSRFVTTWNVLVQAYTAQPHCSRREQMLL
jgi:hypothetical protein